MDKDLNPSLCTVLYIIINLLCKNLSWLQALSPKQRFSWGIVASFCAKIPISSDQFEWIHSYWYVIKQLGLIYKAYCERQQLTEQQRVLSEHFPGEIANGPSEVIRR